MVQPDIKEAFFAAYPEISPDKIMGSLALKYYTVNHFNSGDPTKSASLCDSEDPKKGKTYIEFTRHKGVACFRERFLARTFTNAHIYSADVGFIARDYMLYQGFEVSDRDYQAAQERDVNLLAYATKFPTITVASAIDVSTTLASLTYLHDAPQSSQYSVYFGEEADFKSGVWMRLGCLGGLSIVYGDNSFIEGHFGDRLVGKDGFEFNSGFLRKDVMSKFGRGLIYFQTESPTATQTLVVPDYIDSREMVFKVLDKEWRKFPLYLFSYHYPVTYTRTENKQGLPDIFPA